MPPVRLTLKGISLSTGRQPYFSSILTVAIMSKQQLFSFLSCSTLLILLVIGCSTEPSTTTGKGSSKASTQAKKPRRRRPVIKVPQDAYSDLDAAINSAVAAKAQGDNKAAQRAEIWLKQQGSGSIPALATILHDQDAELPRRITACRALAALGPPARADVLKAISSDQRSLRIAATERISLIRPSDKQTVERLVQLLDDQDQQWRKIAIQSLRRIGTSARQAIPKLDTLANESEDEIIRAEALKALKTIDPRHTLSDLRDSKK